ncbi:MAG TPA: hypothetical protein PLS93_06200 [Accumulibacter sp.]|nr:hypothetical protein [Accumulibacter sp.]
MSPEHQLVTWNVAVAAFLVGVGLAAFGGPLEVRLLLWLITLASIWLACTRTVGTMHPISIYVLASSVYVLAAAIEIVAFGNRLDLDVGRMGQLTDAGVGFLLCAAIGHVVVTATCRPATARLRQPSLWAAAQDAQVAVNVCIALCTVSVAMTVQRYGLAIGTLTRAELYADEYVLLSLVRGVVTLSLAATAALIVNAEALGRTRLSALRWRLLAALAAYVAADLVLLGDRRLPLIAVIAVATVMRPRRFTWRQSTAVAAGVALLIVYGLVRNTPPGEWASVLSGGDLLPALSPAANEFGGMAIIGGALETLDSTPRDFPGYLDAFTQILPRSIVTDRPLSPTEWFVSTYFPFFAEIGASFAFNAVIEAFLNGGVLMIAIAGSTTGAFIAGLSLVRWRGAPIGVPIAAYIFTFSMRMDLASQLRTAIVALAGLAVLLSLINIGRMVRLGGLKRRELVQ